LEKLERELLREAAGESFLPEDSNLTGDFSAPCGAEKIVKPEDERTRPLYEGGRVLRLAEVVY
jgi:hypothetical protein